VINNLVFKEVLKHIHQKGYIKINEISRELKIPKSLAEQVIEELKKKNYLETATPSNEARCNFCLLKSKCRIKTACVIKSYVLTEKAKRLLKINS